MGNLTDRTIRGTKCPEGLNQTDLPDGQVRGLVLRVYRSGAKSWALHYRRREDNRRRRLTLGTYPGVTLKSARELAAVELGKIATGDDPQGEREEVRARGGLDSVAEVAQGYLEHYSKPNKRIAGYAMDCWQLETYVLPRWGKRGIREISKRDVKRLLEDLAAGTIAAGGEPTKVAPRNLRAVLSKMFEWATDQEILPANPAAGVKLPAQVRQHLKKGGRDRVLSDEEVGILWRQLDQLEADAEIKSQAPVSAAAFRLILLTAQRPGEVFSMRWCDVEDGEWWVVPAEVAKNGEANRVYLSPAGAPGAARPPRLHRRRAVGAGEPVQGGRAPDDDQDRQQRHPRPHRHAPLDAARPAADGGLEDERHGHRPPRPPGDPQPQGPQRHRRLRPLQSGPGEAGGADAVGAAGRGAGGRSARGGGGAVPGEGAVGVRGSLMAASEWVAP